jgi:transcriptional regulator GlxA family with amidase domain
MANTIGILLFDGAEEMDFAGPWEVLAAAAEEAPGDRVLLIAENSGPVVCEKGMRVLPDVTYADAPALDVVLVPGGSGARREIANPATVEWLTRAAAGCAWVTSVCTGSFLLVGAGLAAGRRVTTHHAFIDRLRELGGAEVVEGVRFVRDGNLVSAGGVMSGIEMTLWLVGQLYGPEAVERTKSYIAYDYPPRASAQGDVSA